MLEKQKEGKASNLPPLFLLALFFFFSSFFFFSLCLKKEGKDQTMKGGSRTGFEWKGENCQGSGGGGKKKESQSRE